MIKSIRIKNFLTIKDIELNFDEHFNAIVGESGSGKSLILKAINEIFSSKNDTEMIGNFADSSTISIDFEADLSKYGFLQKVFKIEKIIKKSKSQLLLNNRTLSNKTAQTIKNEIVNIVSQDYRFELFEKDKFLEVLDLFVDTTVIEDYKSAFEKFNETKKAIHELEHEIKNIENSHPEILLELIEKVNPKENEYDELIEKRKQIKQDLAIKDFISQLNNLLYEGQNNIFDAIVSSFKKINALESKKIQSISNALDKILNELIAIKPLFEQNTDDEISIDNIEKRLFELENLQRKFAKSLNEIIAEKKHLKGLIEKKDTLKEQITKQKIELENLEVDLLKAAENLSAQRKQQAQKFILGIKKNMRDLMLEDADFDIVFNTTDFTLNGQDKIILLFSANKDLPKKELQKIASGGEKSRFILALFEYIGQKNKNTLIFDEIEEGTGGKTLEAIAIKLKKLSLENQLICITHSSEIQKVADKVFTIQKSFKNSNTVSYLCQG
ncbi:AAA family ATPase [Desulfurella multipotens]|uniref:AAA family ATPase n=1 Tax=Desulfurella TaxID=33001 RepID=UPI000CB6D78E|nr:AAA family ATPase [Desulfurella multipotens]PMP68271.1 MAG: hypothetical protein C0192_02260 [Desulfurella multipotens]